MSEMIYVKPAEGGRVRQPERLNHVMPAEGAFVPRNAHYERLLLTGDVLAADAPQKSAPAAEPAKSETPSPTSARSRRASGAQEE